MIETSPQSPSSSSVSISFGYPSEGSLIELIQRATESITYVGPGMTVAIARAIDAGRARHPDLDIQVTLDLDPQVCRLGYSELDAIEIIEGMASLRPGLLTQRTGIRLCVLTVDGQTTVFPPVPRLVESADHMPDIGAASVPVVQRSQVEGFGRHAQEALAVGPANAETLEHLRNDLRRNPPLPFDLSQKVHVFNSRFEFVEFELKGLALSRKKVPLPAFLMGLSRDPKTQRLLQSSFRLIGDDTDLSSDVVLKLKKSIIDRHLTTLPKYGTVILRAQKPRFERSVRLLKHFIERYQKKVESLLADEMKKNREAVVKMLFPLVRQNIPSQWRKHLCVSPSDTELRDLLREELARAFGDPQDHFQKMSCSVIYKGITYELLNDPQFIETARRYVRASQQLHVEYQAAKARSRS